MIEELTAGFLTGAANSAFCLGACAPVLVPFLLSENRKPLAPVCLFLLGRFIAYIVFAAGAGAAGIYYAGMIPPYWFAVLTCIMAAWLIGHSLGGLRTPRAACSPFTGALSRRGFPFFTGLVMGLNLCPPFLLGLNRALQSGSIITPVIFFTGFFAGSSLWILPALIPGKWNTNEHLRKWGRVIGIAMGAFYLALGIRQFIQR
jgi:hypothetical protein